MWFLAAKLAKTACAAAPDPLGKAAYSAPHIPQLD